MASSAPRLRPVEEAGTTVSGYAEYSQAIDEPASANGRTLAPGDEWIGGVLYPDHLGVGFAERLADLPHFIRQVEALAGRTITAIRGTASEALPGDPLLLGDWIKAGTFDPARLARRFDAELGGVWTITSAVKDPTAPVAVYEVEIARTPGT